MNEPAATETADIRLDDSLTEAQILALTDGDNHLFVASDTGSVWIVLAGPEFIRIDINNSLVFGGKNNTGVAIDALKIVAVNGADGTGIDIELVNVDSSDEYNTVGMTESSIADGATDAKIKKYGYVVGMDLSSFSNGDKLYCAGSSGGLTATKPTTGKIIYFGEVLLADATYGTLFVDPSIEHDEFGTATSIRTAFISEDEPAEDDPKTWYMKLIHYFNRILWSEDIAQAAWNKTNDVGSSPTVFIADSSTGTHELSQLSTVSKSGEHCFKFKLDVGNAPYIRAQMFNATIGIKRVSIKTDDAAVSDESAGVTTIASVSGSELTVRMSADLQAVNTTLYIYPSDAAGSSDFASGDGVITTYEVMESQISLGSAAANLPYLPTTTVAVSAPAIIFEETVSASTTTTSDDSTTILTAANGDKVVVSGTGVNHQMDLGDATTYSVGYERKIVNASSEIIGVANSDLSVWERLLPTCSITCTLLDNSGSAGVWDTVKTEIQARNGQSVSNHFQSGGSATSGPLSFTSISSGSGSSVFVNAFENGSLALGTGTTSTGSSLAFSVNRMQTMNEGPYQFSTNIALSALSDGVNDYAVKVGFVGVSSTVPQ